jgi:PAS domain S-box-containing protein
MHDADTRASDLPAGTDTPPQRHTAGARRPLPAGISEQLSDEAPRLLDELHARDDTLAQQAQLVRQLQTALQRAQSTNQELALVADRVTDAILICDAQRCIKWVNPSFTRLTGFTLTECHGQLTEELLSGPHTDPAVITRVNQTLAQGQSVDKVQVCHHRKDGEPFWVERSVQPIMGPEGQINRYIEVLTDISAARRAETEHAQRLQAEVALATKADFMSRMSHSMRSRSTPSWASRSCSTCSTAMCCPMPSAARLPTSRPPGKNCCPCWTRPWTTPAWTSAPSASARNG